MTKKVVTLSEAHIVQWSMHVKHMLGHPVVIVELDKDQIRSAIQMALEWQDDAELTLDRPVSMFDTKRYAVALCKQMLGRIRSKFPTQARSDGTAVTMDGAILIAEARQDMIDLGAIPAPPMGDDEDDDPQYAPGILTGSRA